MPEQEQGGSPEGRATETALREHAEASPGRLELGRTNDPTASDDTYEPSTVQINHGRMQGLGMGAKDLQGQGDPGGGDDETQTERLRRATARTSPDTGLPLDEAQKASTPEPGYPVRDGDNVDDDSQEDSNRRA